MRCTKIVEFRFTALGETRYPTFFAQTVHQITATSEDLVWIRFMNHIPDQAVTRCLEDVMQSERELNHAEIRRQMTAGLVHGLQHKLAQLMRQRIEIRAFKCAQIMGGLNVL